ncbi:hypothetical protein ACP90_05200 [Labrenzia sp. CP4]|nr:hypothetical protein ACP90_05200 [Labrenzia sp. CP4]
MVFLILYGKEEIVSCPVISLFLKKFIIDILTPHISRYRLDVDFSISLGVDIIEASLATST